MNFNHGGLTIKYDAAKSVLKLRLGDEIRLTAAAFQQIATAFLMEIAEKYS